MNVRTSVKLQPHQERYVKALLPYPTRGLPLRMGKGKTAIMLEVLKHDKESHHLKSNIALIIAPKNIMHNVWQQEAKKFGHDFTFHVLHGKGRKNIPTADIYLINPEGLLAKNLSLPKCHALIFDESTKFKNYNSKRFKAAKQLLPHFTRRTIMTGTPTPRGMLNLWSQIYLLDEGKRLGKSYFAFRNKYFKQSYPGSYDWFLPEENKQKILDKIKDIFHHYEEEDPMKPLYNQVYVYFDEKTQSAYHRFKHDWILPTTSIEAKSAADLRLKLRQFTSGTIYDNDHFPIAIHDIKLEMLEGLIESQNGDPTIILYNFNHELDRITNIFKNEPVINGETSIFEVNRIIEQWNHGVLPVLIANPVCMGHGLNLQYGGSTMLWYSLTDDLEVYEQCNARLARPGQTREVIIHHLLVKNTVDEVMMEALENKGNVQRAIMTYLKQG